MSTNTKPKSQLGKRTFNEAFGNNVFDDARYDTHIEPDYFEKGGIGHGVFVIPDKDDPELNRRIQETYAWCLDYLKQKGKTI